MICFAGLEALSERRLGEKTRKTRRQGGIASKFLIFVQNILIRDRVYR